MTNLNISIQSQIKSTVASEVEFAVDFNDAWQWLEYSRKDAAKRVLVANFESGIDYLTTHNKVERQIIEEIYLTKDCFKQLAMLSNTAKGKEVRLYFLKCEKELRAVKESNVVKAPSTLKEAMQVALAAIEAQEIVEKQLALVESKVVEMTPKVQMYEAICETGKNVKVGELAKILSIKNMGQNNMFSFLRNQGILQPDNIPYQTYINSGYFTCVKTKKGGEVYIVTLVTPKGFEL